MASRKLFVRGGKASRVDLEELVDLLGPPELAVDEVQSPEPDAGELLDLGQVVELAGVQA
jgi:hypothetical protein